MEVRVDRVDPLNGRELLAHRNFVRSLARELVRDAATADDVTQEAMARLLEVPRPGSIRPWLRTVARNLARRLGRRERRRAEVEGGRAPDSSAGARATAPATDELAARLELQRRLTERVLALEPRARDVVILHFYEGKTVAEVAEQLGVPLETARTRLRRALAELRAGWNGELGGEREGLAALAVLARWGPAKGLVAAAGATAAASPFLWTGVAAMTAQTKAIAVVLTLLVTSASVFFSLHRSSDSHGSRPGESKAPSQLRDSAFANGHSPTNPVVSDPPMREPVPSPKVAVEDVLGSVLVRVIWKRDGTPAADVEVACDQGGVRNLGRTSSDGIVVLDHLQPGRVSIGGDRGGRATTTVEGGRQSEVTLELGPGITILGRVEDSRGDAVAGAEIWLSEGTNFVSGHVVAFSGVDGCFSIRDVGAHVIDRGEMFHASTPETTTSRLVGARARGFIPSDVVTLDVRSEWKPLRLVLPGRGASLSGLVLDPEGKPVPRASVVLHRESRARVNGDDSLSKGGMTCVTLGSLRSTTDESGRFRFLGWCSGQSLLIVRTPAWAIASERIDLPEGAETDREVRLHAGVTVKGVVSQPDDESAAFVLVQCRSDCAESTAFTYTSEDGSYTLNCVPAGEFEIQAEKRNRRTSEQFRARAGETIHWSPLLRGGAGIQGLLVDDSHSPLESWLIDATEESQRRPVPGTGTDHNGAFVLKSLEPSGIYQLTVRNGPIAAKVLEHVRSGSPISIVIPSDRQPSSAIEGVVVDPAGNGILGARVLLKTELGAAQVTTEGGDGRFRIERLTPGSYSVVICAEGFSELHLEDHQLHPNESWHVGTCRLAKK